jgi:thiazole synthase ThiGH ThiG subunit
MQTSLFNIGDKTFQSRLFLGTGKFGSNEEMEAAILASESELVTVALKRIDLETDTDAILSHLNHPNINLLPNTSGARNAKEAVFAKTLEMITTRKVGPSTQVVPGSPTQLKQASAPAAQPAVAPAAPATK